MSKSEPAQRTDPTLAMDYLARSMEALCDAFRFERMEGREERVLIAMMRARDMMRFAHREAAAQVVVARRAHRRALAPGGPR